MGQVPNDTLPYLLVGDGRLSRHLQRYFDLEGISWRLWSRSQGRPFEDAATAVRAILLLISDDAIEPFLDRHADPTGPQWIHCAGSLSTPHATGVHPLMTFGDELYDLSVYRRIPFVCDRGGPAFPELFPGLANPHATIDPGDRPLYHAICTMAGSFTTLLWLRAFEVFEDELGLPRSVLFPFLDRTAANLERAVAPLTGPLARRDRRTISRHLSALAGDPLEEVYRSFLAVHRSAAPAEAP